ncbi:alpha/beta hydrolase [Streptomyces sp. NPDC029216]|uniref:alpha/beta fold hydrolase n=1 Tax=Streptomyces sp. NPDC029216 TaxID=3154701 RepID=UPI0033C4E189
MNPLFGNGAKCVFDDFGPTPGEPVILIHGRPSHRSVQVPQTAAPTAAGHRGIAPDLRGCGENPATEEESPRAASAGDPAEPLRGPGIERTVVGGVSKGGRIATGPGLRHPGLVRALVLSDTSPAPETAEGAAFRRRTAERLLTEGTGPYAAGLIDTMLAPSDVTGQPEASARVGAMKRATGPRVRRPADGAPEAVKWPI